MSKASQEHERPPIVALVGPTAVGKTDEAVRLCEALGGEIVGADSVQVYRGLDVGSAKPTPEVLRGVPHHLIDVVEPDEAIDAARYAALADAAITDVARRGAVPVVCGGTGLWLRALLRGLVALPPVDGVLRAQLEAEWDSHGAPTMHSRLARIDPESAGTIHPNDKLRVVRALEVHAQTGEALGALRRRHALGAPRYKALVMYLDLPREVWRARVHERTRGMLQRGWIAEVLGLAARYQEPPRALGAVGYRQVLAHVRGELAREDLADAIDVATHGYGKRQRTWFKGDSTVTHHLVSGHALEEQREAIERHLKQ